MNYINIIKNTLLTLAAAFVIFFAPIDDNKASAAETSVSELNETATKYLGVRYSYGGTSASGFDCSGYVRHVFKELGIDSLPRTSGEMYGEGEKVEKSDLQEGDLVFFKTSGRGTVSHVGIYIGSDQFIHASSSKGVIKTSINDKYYWGSKYVGAKRVAQFAANE
ncbi:MAG: C40 family peptidase [Solibacillus sp.]